MAKRFTDNEKWKDAWFMDLPSKYKLFWLYLLDECNHAGIWKVNFKVATFYVGEHLEHSEVKRILKDRIDILNDEYWYINKFIKYQYKCEIEQLNPKNKAHLSALNILNEYDKFKPLISPLLGVKDKDKDKDKDFFTNTDNKIKNNNIFLKELLTSQSWLETTAMQSQQKFNVKQVKFFLNKFNDYLSSTFENKPNKKEYAKHFVNWLKTQKKTTSPSDNIAF